MHTFKVLGARNRFLYLSIEENESIGDLLSDLTLKKINKLFEEAEHVRKIISKI
ncbi:MAG: hypothetical protein ACE5KT_08415 [Methanosarcinales archaeon]